MSSSGERPFLTANWRLLAMLNFEVDPSTLVSRVPPGTELDTWQCRTLVSLVGFRFENTRLQGFRIPCHSDFDEVNLRFYVRRETAKGIRRGVVFIRELVPRRAIAWTARAVYGENYSAVSMRNRIERLGSTLRVEYGWSWRGRENRMEIAVTGEPQVVEAGSEAEFITEHYWGYARDRRGTSLEYRVAHSPWKVWPADQAGIDCDAASLYGVEFRDCMSDRPVSAFLADGSGVEVFRGTRLG